jgi:hypothetical protein
MAQVPYGEPDDVVVTYGVKELLSDIKESITRIDTKLDGKADKSHVDAVEARVTALEVGVAAVKNRAVGAAAAASLLAGGAGISLAKILF